MIHYNLASNSQTHAGLGLSRDEDEECTVTENHSAAKPQPKADSSLRCAPLRMTLKGRPHPGADRHTIASLQ